MSADSQRCDPDGHCVTCSDEGLPMRAVRSEGDGLALCVDDQGTETVVMTDLVGAVSSGEALLVHAGVALARLEAGSA